MRLDYLDIISVFSEELNRELTIRQISKLIKKSYAFTNKHVHDLINEEILHKREIGSALLCKLNLSNEETIGLLSLSSIRKKKKLINIKNLQNSLNSLPSQKICFVHKNVLFIISNEKQVLENIPSFKLKIFSEKDFFEFIREVKLLEVYPIHNHELFWRLIRRV